MLVSKKGRYSVRALATLAYMEKKTEGAPVKLSVVAEMEKLPISYIEQLFNKMRRSDLLKSVKGPGGGYLLYKSSDEITILDILLSVGEFTQSTDCQKDRDDHKNCNLCFSGYVWDNVYKNIRDYLGSVTVTELVEKQEISRR